MFQIVFDNTYSRSGSPAEISPSNESSYDINLPQAITSELPTLLTQNSSDWGPKRDPLYIVVPITVLYSTIFFVGVIGNVSTCIVIARNKSMHTATNYYLFSLAVSDLLLLISGLPPEIYFIWSKYPYIFGEVFCVLQGFAAETSANATVLTITAFTIERYVAICHPFLSHTMSKLSRAVKFVVLVWIVAMCLAVPQAMSFGIFYERYPDGTMTNDDHYVCIVKRVVIPHAFEISTFLFFVAPMSMITILYVLIGLQLHRSTVGPSRGNSVKLKHRVYKPMVTYTNTSTQAVLVINADSSETVQLAKQDEDGRKNFPRNAQAAKHVVKMLVAVVVAFFICWAPFHAQRLLAVYGQPTTSNMITAFRVLTYVSGILYYLSTTINPLLYHIMSHRFREAFKDTFNRFFRRGRRIPGSRCYSTLSGRSSQLNSHSNTDSCSRQSSLRYLDAEMARLRNSRRPLVVSFRRKKEQLPKQSKQVVFDSELQEALDSLQESVGNDVLNEGSPNEYQTYAIPIYDQHTNLNNDCSFVELHNLEPKHVCPMMNNTKFPYVIQNAHETKGTDGLRDQRLKLNKVKRDKRNFYRGRQLRGFRSDKSLTKSCTMPQLLFNRHNVVGGNKQSNLNNSPRLFKNNHDVGIFRKKNEKSNSCFHLEFIMENSGNHLSCRPSDGIIIQIN